MAMPMNSASFRSAVTPVLNKIFDGVYNLRKDEWKQVFKQEQGIPRSYHEEPVFYGLGAAPQIPDGQPVTFQAGGELFKAVYLYSVYGLGFALTKILVEDGDHVRLGKIFSEHLANAMIETKETLTANVLNRAFNSTYVGGDGAPLNSSAHRIQNGTFSNVLATPAALSQTSLEQMIIMVRNAVDNNGKKVRLTPKKLIIPTSQIMQAEVILKSVLRTGSTVNDINPINSRGDLKDVAVISRLTSNTAWWIQTDAPQGLKLLMRRSLEKAMEGDWETDNMKYKATERYGVGWTDPRAVFGTPGQ